MPGCCSGYERVFTPKRARDDARRYQSKGLDPTARRVVDELARRGIPGATVLEVGGGVGGVQIELLRAGAARATSVELTATYEESAMDLLRERGFDVRVARHVADFARGADAFEPTDVVVLHRVVCCYPDMRALVRAAAEHARRFLALTYPPDRWWWRLARPFANAWYALTADGFRIHLHSPREILAVASDAGLRLAFHRVGWAWEVAILER